MIYLYCSKLSVLLLVAFSAIACNQGFSSASSHSGVSSQPGDYSSLEDISSSQDQSSGPDIKTYHPINESWVDEDVFSKSVDYALESTLLIIR